MQEKQTPSMFQNSSAFLFLKTQLADFNQSQTYKYKSLHYLVDLFVQKQRVKNNYLPQDYFHDVQSILSELQIYSADLVVQLTSFPLMNNLAKIISKLIAEYSQVLNNTQDYWSSTIKTLKREVSKHEDPSPVMDMCLNCSENVRQQEINQARARMFKPIADPFHFYQTVLNSKNDYLEEARQKELQDKLNQLANNMEYGRSCLQDMIHKISLEENSTQEISVYKDSKSAADLCLIPLVKSLYQRIKGPKKVTNSFGVQTHLAQKEREVKLLELPSEDFDIRRSRNRIQSQRSEKKIPQLEERQKELEKKMAQLKDEITILKIMNGTLQIKNSELEFQITMLKAQKPKVVFKYQHSRSSTKKIVENIYDEEPTTPVVNNEPQERVEFQRKRKSHKTEARMRKGEMVNNVLSSLLPLNKAGQLSKNEVESSMNSSLKQPRHPGRQKSTIYKQTDLTSLSKRQISSTHSLVQVEDCINDDDDDDSDTTLKRTQANKTFNQFTPSDQLPQQRSISKTKTKTLTKINQFQADSKVKEELKTSKKNTYTKFNSSKTKLSMSQKRKMKEMVEQAEAAGKRQMNSTRKGRRLATIYNREEILKIIYDEEIKEKQNNINYQEFQEACNGFIEKTVADKSRKSQQNVPKKLYLNDETATKSVSKDSSKLKNLHKKSALSLKQRLRSDMIRPTMDSIKRNKKQASQHSFQNYVEKQFEERDLNTPDGVEFPKLKSNIFLKPSQEAIKNITLSKAERQTLTEIMAHLCRLKSKSRNNYEAMRRFLFSSKNKDTKNEKQALQSTLTQLINSHRSCNPQKDDTICAHLRQLVDSVIKLIV